MTANLDQLRAHAHKLFIGLLWAHVPLNCLVSWLVGGSTLTLTTMTLACAAAATVQWLMSSNQTAVRVTNAVALMGVVSLLLAAMAGHAWQVDIHMYYFAAVALVAIYCDPVAIVAAAATVALHHLSLNFLLPAAIYPGGADLGRVVLHAVILILESAGLVWMTFVLNTAFSREGSALERAKEATLAAEKTAQELRMSKEAEAQHFEQQRQFQQTVSAQQAGLVELLGTKLAQVATGDLTTRIDEKVDGEFEKITVDFNTAIERLELAFQRVNERGGHVRMGTDQITAAANDLARRTESEAASLEEASAALNEVTSSASHAAEGAAHARDAIAAADKQAQATAVIVERAIAAINAITESSSQIGQIVGVIDEIAFQTNLLALNAGVEAARAGDSGRGFAVVANEVRALAQRSAQAAKEIKTLISGSTEQVDQGAALVRDAGDALRVILMKVSDLNAIVVDMSNAAKEQAASLGEVNMAVAQMEKGTQQNAAVAQETNAASASLRQQSDELAKLIAEFRTTRSSNIDLRSELQRVAPHAFGAPTPSRQSHAGGVRAVAGGAKTSATWG